MLISYLFTEINLKHVFEFEMFAFGTCSRFESCTIRWSVDASIVRCSMMCQTFIRRCHSSFRLSRTCNKLGNVV